MANDSLSPMSRRGLFRLGILVAMFGSAGCGPPGAGSIELPANKGSAARLDKMKDMVDQAKSKQNKKR